MNGALPTDVQVLSLRSPTMGIFAEQVQVGRPLVDSPADVVDAGEHPSERQSEHQSEQNRGPFEVVSVWRRNGGMNHTQYSLHRPCTTIGRPPTDFAAEFLATVKAIRENLAPTNSEGNEVKLTRAGQLVDKLIQAAPHVPLAQTYVSRRRPKPPFTVVHSIKVHAQHRISYPISNNGACATFLSLLNYHDEPISFLFWTSSKVLVPEIKGTLEPREERSIFVYRRCITRENELGISLGTKREADDARSLVYRDYKILRQVDAPNFPIEPVDYFENAIPVLAQAIGNVEGIVENKGERTTFNCWLNIMRDVISSALASRTPVLLPSRHPARLIRIRTRSEVEEPVTTSTDVSDGAEDHPKRPPRLNRSYEAYPVIEGEDEVSSLYGGWHPDGGCFHDGGCLNDGGWLHTMIRTCYRMF